MQGELLSCHATAWCSSDLQGKSVWSAETCRPHPSQTLASQSLWGGGAHFLPLSHAELLSPETIQMYFQTVSAVNRQAFLCLWVLISINKYYWPERRWRHRVDVLCWNSADNGTQPRGHYPRVLLSWPTSVWRYAVREFRPSWILFKQMSLSNKTLIVWTFLYFNTVTVYFLR